MEQQNLKNQEALAFRLLRKIADYFFTKEQGYSHDISTHLPYLLIYLACLTIPFFLSLPDPSAEEQALSCCGITLPGSCLSKELFGCQCPGCGMTRSFTAFTHGEFAQSFQFNRVGILLYIFFCYQAIYRIYCLCILDRSIPASLLKLQNSLPWVIISLLIINWFYNVL